MDEKKIKILFLLPTLDFSSPTLAVLRLAKNLPPRKFNIFIGSIRKPKEKAKERVEKYTFKVIDFRMKSLFDFFVIFRIRNFLLKEKIDILHNFGFRPEIFGGIAGRLAKTKVILATILHNPEIDIPLEYGKFLGAIMNFFRRIFSFWCEDALILLSKDSQKGIENLKFNVKNVKIIPSGLDLEILLTGIENFSKNEVLIKLGVQSDKFLVGSIGVLKPRKGYIYLIEAAKKVIEKYPNVVFVIVGSGSQEKELREKIKNLNLSNHFVFKRYYENIAEIYKIINLFVLPSLTEGVPAVLLEAMAFEVPIIATDVGGIPEMIENNVSGVLVPPKDSEKLAEAIIKLYENSELAKKMAQKAKERFEKYFTAEKMAKDYEKVYEELMEKSKIKNQK